MKNNTVIETPNPNPPERIFYPCDHTRVVQVGKRGWNYCPECRRNYCVMDIGFEPPKPRPVAPPPSTEPTVVQTADGLVTLF